MGGASETLIDECVRRCIHIAATKDSVFASLDAELTAPHESTLLALHDMYARQRALLHSSARVASWFPGAGGGSTFFAIMFAVTAVTTCATARVLLITTSKRGARALDDALAHFDVARADTSRMFLYASIEEAIRAPTTGESYTHIVIDFDVLHPKKRSAYKRLYTAVTAMLAPGGTLRLVGTPPTTALVAALFHLPPYCS